MVEPTRQAELFPSSGEPPDGAVVVNERCLVRAAEGRRIVVVHGLPVAHYAVGDRMAEAHAMVTLVDLDWADQNDVAQAFARSARSVRRYQARFEAGGLAALGREGGYPKGQLRLAASRGRRVLRLKARGLSNREIARRLGVTEKAVRKQLRRLGWQAPRAVQGTLALGEPAADPNLSASATSPPVVEPRSEETPATEGTAAADPNLSASSAQAPPLSWDRDPADRRLDRLLAALGLLDDAAPLFECGARVPGAGVLLALPALIASDVLTVAREVYGTLGPAFYGLRTTVLTLLFMALLRLKRPETLKEHAPQDLGRVLGLDRAPEVKTLRRKLTRLAAFGRAVPFGRALAERRVATRGAALGYLYVDGHVRVYHGEHPLPKAHVARMRLALPATSDYWVNDAAGEPLFVVTAEANAGLVRMLPTILPEIRRLVGERRVTVVFDRGGWSPRLFQQLVHDGFDLLTYRKGRVRHVPRSHFRERKAVFDSREVTYTLADQGVRLPGSRLRLRQVTRLSPDGHQTPIVTSRRDLPDIEVAFRMFARWRQENFFKYLREEYALDALVDYGVVPADPARDVPNPARHALDAEIRQARADLAGLQAQYGRAALANPERRRPTMRGFKIAHGTLGRTLRAAMRRVAALEARRAATPARVPVHQVVAGAVVKLAPEKQHLTSVLRMVAFQAESDLVRQLAPHYRRAEDEGRTLIQSALATAGDLEVADGELRVRLAPLSSRHRTRALAALCEELNRADAVFPGSRLRLRYRVGAAP